MLVFGGNLTAANLLNYLVRNLDNVLIGWRWGADALGFYAKAYQLLLLPIRQFNTPLTSVAIPALSRLQDKPGQFCSYYKRGVQMLVSVGMPVVVFTFVAADQVVLLILGDQWVEAVPIFRVLAPAAFVGTFNVASGWVYVSLARTHRQLRWTIIGSSVTVTGFFIGLPFGPLGVAAACSICLCGLRIPGLSYCFKGTPLKLRDLGTAIWRPAVASVAAGALVSVCAASIVAGQHLAVQLLVYMGIFAIGYVMTWRVLPGGWAEVRHIMSMFGEFRKTAEDSDADTDHRYDT